MRKWSKVKEKKYSEEIRFTISNIDEAIFDDPVMLLEYLDQLDAKKEKEGSKLPIHISEHRDISTSRRVSGASAERETPLKGKHGIQSSGQRLSLDIAKSKKDDNTIIDNSSDNKSYYCDVDDFILYIMNKGVPIKDNRRNDGCVWVGADPHIEELMKKTYIKGRQFRYASKCRAFNGEPGWYY